MGGVEGLLKALLLRKRFGGKKKKGGFQGEKQSTDNWHRGDRGPSVMPIMF